VKGRPFPASGKGGAAWLLFVQNREIADAEIGYVKLIYLELVQVHLFYDQVPDYNPTDYQKTDG
jgi:hypothetical protein